MKISVENIFTDSALSGFAVRVLKTSLSAVFSLFSRVKRVKGIYALPYAIQQNGAILCTGCGICEYICPSKAISLIKPVAIKYNYKKCLSCLQCVAVCPVSALDIADISVSPQMIYGIAQNGESNL